MIELHSSRDFGLRGDALAAARVAAAQDAAWAVVVLLALVFVGSAGFRHLDLALLGYLAAVVASTAILAYRVSVFWRRPASAEYARSLSKALRNPREWPAIVVAVWRKILSQGFIRKRSVSAWRAHLLLAFGTIVGFAVTLPLVFGWLRFEAAGERTYRALVFSIPTISVSVDGFVGWSMFHALILAAAAVLCGAAVLLRRRLQSEAAAAMAPFHVIPLVLLALVSVSGLALPVAGAWARDSFPLVALVHEVSVVALLLALPFSKLFHLFVRPLHLGVEAMRAREPLASCARCSGPMPGTAKQIAAADTALRQNGSEMAARLAVCPACRRRERAIVQDRALGGALW